MHKLQATPSTNVADSRPRHSLMKALLALLLCCTLGFSGAPTLAQESPKRISLEQLETMFSKIRSETKWNADGPLTWSYFFLHHELPRLEMVAAHLEKAGYEVTGIGKVQGRPLFRLRAKKLETHTPATLDARNNELYDFAARGGFTYDGMDVGPVE